MNFLDKLRLALGFGPDAGVADDPLYADTAGDAAPSDNVPSHGVLPSSPSVEVSPVEFDAAMQDAIFDKVVEVFNESLPPFIAGSVDPEAQRRYLRGCLDEGISNYLKSLNKAAEDYCEARWKARRSDMAAELDAIKLRAEDVERKSNDIQQKQLSADRQKRALTEKVHELESRLARLVSEREQFELENRSLINRLKVSNVHQDDVEKARAETEALRAELSKMREDPSLVSQRREEELLGVIAERDKEIAELNELVSEFEGAVKDMEKVKEQMLACQEKIASQKKTIRQRDDEIASLKDTIAENIKNQAEREQLLRNEIEQLRPPMVMTGREIDFSEETEEDAMPRISEDDLSAIEASFEAEYTAPVPEPLSAVPPAQTDPEPQPQPEPQETPKAHDPAEESPRTMPRRQKNVGQPEARKEPSSKKSKPEQLSLF